MKQGTNEINSRDHVAGNIEAPLVLVEYGDYECPHCRWAHPIVKHLQQRFGEELAFVFRNFPLPRIHPHAFSVAVAAEAAAVQDKFWEMHDIVLENQKALESGDIYVLAGNIGLDLSRWKMDMQRLDLADKVEMDFEKGLRLGVHWTPTFFVNGIRYERRLDEELLIQFVEEQRASARA